jgi:hypothetical protein
MNPNQPYLELREDGVHREALNNARETDTPFSSDWDRGRFVTNLFGKSIGAASYQVQSFGDLEGEED